MAARTRWGEAAEAESRQSASALCTATGFSTSTWQPAESAAQPSGTWEKCGVAISTASTRPLASSAPASVKPGVDGKPASTFSDTSQTAPNSQPANLAGEHLAGVVPAHAARTDDTQPDLVCHCRADAYWIIFSSVGSGVAPSEVAIL